MSDPFETPGIGHNSDTVIQGAAQARLRSFVERVERLNADKADIMADIKEVFSEAKAEGFDGPILRKVISERKKDAAKREEQQAIFDLYWDAIT